MKINPAKKNIDDFVFEDFMLEGYDLGFANLLVEKLLQDKDVGFAAVEYAHPTQQTLQESLDPRFIAKRLSQLYIISRAVDAAVREST